MKTEKLADWFSKNRKHVVMPNIQRNFVWKEKQIELLFDSINKDYFIGMFLLWKPENENELKKIGFWGLPTSYSSKDEQKKTEIEEKNIIGIVDGQQRLSAISIGLHGSYNGKELYFNKNNSKFMFHKTEGINHKKWIKVSDIFEKHKRLDSNSIKFRTRFKKSLFISHVLSGDIEEVTEIFKRVNKGGTPLSNNQALLSGLTKEWGREGRSKLESIRRELKKYNITIDYDFIMKACLFLSEGNIKIRKDSTPDEPILKEILKKWDRLAKAIKKMGRRVSDLGFYDSNITSSNALIPIAYIFYKNKKEKDDVINRYLSVSFLKKIYGGSSDNTLNKVRKVLKKGSLSKLLKEDSFKLTEYDVADILRYKKGKHTYLALRLLYEDYDYTSKTFDQDHMHPSKFFESKEKLYQALEAEGVRTFKKNADQNFLQWKNKKDRLPNLMMLRDFKNKEKLATPLSKWDKKNPISREINYLKPRTSLYLKDFDKFYKLREKQMRIKLKEILIK